MKTIALQTSDGRCIASSVRIADSLISRCMGLFREKALEPQQGLLLIPGGSVHTIGLRGPIDIVFLDRRMRILALAPNVAPRRVRWAPPRAARVLKLAAGRIVAVGLLVGAHVLVQHDDSSRAEHATTRRLPPPASPERARRIEFSLRLPLTHRARVRSDLGCSAGRAGGADAREDAAALSSAARGDD